MKRTTIGSLGLAAVALAIMPLAGHDDARAHCQVPCGIYDDPARITAMIEDHTTIDKAIHQINKLAEKTDVQSKQQLARWVVTKEQHASHIITVMAEYFLAQRVKEVDPDQPGYKQYLDQLVIHHRVIRAAMKTKQVANHDSADALKATIEDLRKLYTK